MLYIKVGTRSDELKLHDMVEGSWSTKEQIPNKYWDKVENPDYEPEAIGSEEFLYINTFEPGTPMPSEGVWEFNGEWVRLDDPKEGLLKERLLEVDQRNREENLKNFSYGSHTYYSDEDSFTAVSISCMGLALNDPVPAPNGLWKTADTEADGLTPIYVALTVGEFLEMKGVLFNRGVANFAVKEYHKNQLKSMYLDPGVSLETMRNYDITTGWN